MSTSSTELQMAPPLVHPSRRVLLALAIIIVVLFVAMLATSQDVSYDTKTADIESAFGSSLISSQIGAYVGMVFVALLLFFGSAVRNALKTSAGSWYADPVFLGFGALAATFASWCVTDIALWKAVDYGDATVIRTVAVISDAGFLPVMASMMALYIGSGLAGLTSGSLPRWLSIASIVVGVTAPLGPLGFIGFMTLPLWLVAVAVWVRLEP